MPRPTTKSELLAAASASFKKLTTLWDGFTPEQAHAPFPAALLTGGTEAHWQRDKCLRDVVIHLHEWHNLVTVWGQCQSGWHPLLNRTHGVTTPRSTNSSSANIRIRPTKQLAISWRHHTSTYSVLLKVSVTTSCSPRSTSGGRGRPAWVPTLCRRPVPTTSGRPRKPAPTRGSSHANVAS